MNINLFKSKLQPIRTDTGKRLNLIYQTKDVSDNTSNTQNNLVTDRSKIQKQITHDRTQREVKTAGIRKQSFTRNIHDFNNVIRPVGEDMESYNNRQDGTYLRVESYSKQESIPQYINQGGNQTVTMRKGNNQFGKIQSVAISSLHSEENGNNFKNNLHYTTMQRKLGYLGNQDDVDSQQESHRFMQQTSNIQSLNPRSSLLAQTPQMMTRKSIFNNIDRQGFYGYIQPQTPLHPMNSSISPQKFKGRKQTLTSQGSVQLGINYAGKDINSMKRFSQLVGTSSQIGLQQRKMSGINYLIPQGHLSESQSENEAKISSMKKFEVSKKNIKNFENILKEQKKEDKKNKKDKNVKEKPSELKKEENDHTVIPNFTKHKTSMHSNFSDGLANGIKRQKAIQRSLSIFNNQTKQTSVTSIDEDSDDDNEDPFKRLENNIKRSPYTIYPDSKFRFIWDFVSCMLIIHQCLIIPLIYAFDDFDPSYLRRADPIFEIWFIFDVFLNFNTGFFLKGVVIMERDMIVKQYLKSWFFIDFISCMPYSMIITNLKINPLSMDSQTQYTIRLGISVLENLRLFRLFRFVKLDKLMIHVQDQISSDLTNSIFRFAKLMMIIFFAAHWLACLFYTVAASLYGKSNNWISDAQLNDASMGERYVNALYWTITTMATVGYGDIKIKTTEERLVVICIMLISGAIYAYIINDIGHIVQRYNFLANQYKEKMTYVNQFLNSKAIPKDLISRINKYLQYNWELKKEHKIEEKEMMDLLNEDLRDRITIYLNGQILHKMKVLNDFKVDFKSQLAFILTKKSFSVDENIVVEEDFGDELFYITQGKVALLHRTSYTYICDLNKDDYFGEIGFFADCPRTCTVKSRDFTDVLILSKESFLDIASMFPDAIDSYYMIHDRISVQQKEYNNLRISCYLCHQKNHIAIDCKRFKSIAGNMQEYYKKFSKANQLKRSFWGNQTMQDKQEDSIDNVNHYYKQNMLVPRTSMESVNFRGKQTTTKSKGKKTPQSQFNKSKKDNEKQQYYEEDVHEFMVDQQEMEIYENQEETNLQNGSQNQITRSKTKIVDEEQFNNLTEVELTQNIQNASNEEFEELKMNYQANETNNFMNILYLEDIKEDDAAFEDEFDEETKMAKTPRIRESNNRLSTTQLQGMFNMRSSVDNVNTLNPQFKGARPGNAQKRSHQQIQIQNVPNNISIQIQANSKADENELQYNFEESNERQIQDQALHSKKQIDNDDFFDENLSIIQKQMRIKPIRGILRNAMQKKMRMKTGKYFAEDSLEDLANQIMHEAVPPEINTPLLRNKQFQSLRKNDARQSLHTLISSRASQEGVNIINSNAINLVKKLTKLSTRKRRQEPSIYSSISNLNEQSPPTRSRFQNSEKKKRAFQNNPSGFNSQQYHQNTANMIMPAPSIYQPIIQVENNNQNIVFNFPNVGNYHIHYHQSHQTENSNFKNDSSNNPPNSSTQNINLLSGRVQNQSPSQRPNLNTQGKSNSFNVKRNPQIILNSNKATDSSVNTSQYNQQVNNISSFQRINNKNWAGNSGIMQPQVVISKHNSGSRVDTRNSQRKQNEQINFDINFED